MLKTNIKYEIASIDDAEKILGIQKTAFLGQARIYNNYQLQPLTQSVESIKNEFSGKTFLKALLNDQIIASARFEEIDDYVTIDRLVVQPEYQNQGIGTALLNEIELRTPNAVAFQLFTGNKSDRNIYLYKKLGYKIVKEEYTGEGIELLHMEKENHGRARLNI